MGNTLYALSHREENSRRMEEYLSLMLQYSISKDEKIKARMDELIKDNGPPKDIFDKYLDAKVNEIKFPRPNITTARIHE